MKFRLEKTELAGKYTRFRNYFRKNGGIANRIIDEAQKENISLYQRVFKDGSIGLKPQMKTDEFVLIKPDGTICHTERESQKFNTRLGAKSWWRKICTHYKYHLREKVVTKERVYVGKHLEETAQREYNKGGPVLNSVMSFHNRKTQFPQTYIGGGMHNFNISKIKDEYGEFSMLYTENYPHA